MSNIDNSMDFFINPVINNNSALNQLSGFNSNSQSEQIEAFEKVFDDVNEQFEKNISDMIKAPESSNDFSNEKNKNDNLFCLLGNNFGPPPGLDIEDFEYSLIQ